jgi:16S rRNA (uracil1498-N3)-methyltransferase
MPQFFVRPENINNQNIFITNVSDILHIKKILRLNKGDKLILSDENIIYEVEIIKITNDSLETKILSSFKSNRILKSNITIAQSILKSVKQDIVIQKATELGVNTIVPLITRNTVVKFKDDKEKSQKVSRWQKIAYESSKQCQRPGIPEICDITSLEELLKQNDYQIKLACVERDAELSLKEFLANNNTVSNILIITGPEGGWDDREFDIFRKNNIALVSLGNLILRAETAVITAISNVVYQYEL